MEAEMVSRIGTLVSSGKEDEANKIMCWLYAYWKLKGQQGWRGVYTTGCVDEYMELILTGNYVKEAVGALIRELDESPSLEGFAKIALAEALYGLGVKPKQETLVELSRKVGFDKLAELSGELSLSRRGRVDEPWLILTQSERFRRVVSGWLEGLRS